MGQSIFSSQEEMEAFYKMTFELNFSGGKDIMNMMGPRFIGCSFEEKSIEIEYDIKDWELNPEGTFHGGMIATCFDTVGGMIAGAYSHKRLITTTSLYLDYLKPALFGDKIRFKAKIIAAGKRMVRVQCEARPVSTGVLSCAATVSYMILEKPTPVKYSKEFMDKVYDN